MTSRCPGSSGGSPVLYDHGYISSPNYPDKYFRHADCRWTLAVRRWQTIRITLFDFELDVKRSGRIANCWHFTPTNNCIGPQTAGPKRTLAACRITTKTKSTQAGVGYARMTHSPACVITYLFHDLSCTGS